MSEFCMRTMGVYYNFTKILNENNEIRIYDDKNNVRVFRKENEFIWNEDTGNRFSDCKMMNLLSTAKFLKHKVETYP